MKKVNQFPQHPQHAAFTPLPMHHFNLKYAKREVKVTTDFPLRRGRASAAYTAELIAHCVRVEREQAISMKKPKPFKFYK